jgi:F-type H+-transporting ATPase subunit gamma
MPDTVEAMSERIQDLVVALDTLRQEHAPDRVVVVYQHYRSGSDFEPRMDQLLPLDPVWLGDLVRKPWSNRRLPGFQAPVEVLVSSLVREHLFLSLFRAMAESHASENASRLTAMEAAERRIQERLESLTGRLKQQRKQEMTEELLDIMAGAAALEEEEEKG